MSASAVASASSTSSPSRLGVRLSRSPLPAVVTSILLLVALSLPLATLASRGLTLTGMTEESVGYRYFDTLRILYGDNERPWLPQGQFMGLIHMGMQLVLTALGYPPNQLFPRIDIWAYASAFLPHLITGAAFVWAFSNFRSVIGLLLLATGLLLATYDPTTSLGTQVVHADYYSWVYSVALIAVGGLGRLGTDRVTVTGRHALLLGIFGAVALGLKPTYAIFPLPLAFLIWLRSADDRFRLRATVWLMVAAVLAIAGFVAIVWLYYLGSPQALITHFRLLAAFSESVSADRPLSTWFTEATLRWPPNFLALVALLPAVLVLAAIHPRPRAVALSLLPSAILCLYVAYQRGYPNTYVETYAFVFAALASVAIAVPWGNLLEGGDGVSARQLDLRRALLRASCALALALLLYQLRVEIRDAIDTRLEAFTTATNGARALDSFFEPHEGRLAVLIPRPDYRPTTVDSAIAKGGTEDGATPRWGMSPYVASLVPNRTYFFGYGAPPRPLDLSPYSKVLFISVPSFGGESEAHARLTDAFGLTLIGFDCSFRTTLVGQEAIGCLSRVERLATDGAGPPTATLATTVPSADVGGRLTSRPCPPSGADHCLVFVAPMNALWRVTDDLAVVRLLPEADGQRVRLAGVSYGEPGAQGLRGLDIVARAGRWVPDPAAFTVVNENPTLQGGSETRPPPGWALSPANAAAAFATATDENGRYLVVKAHAQGPALALQGLTPSEKLDDLAVTVLAVVRAHGSRPVTLTLFDVTGANSADYVSATASTSTPDTWTTLTVRTERMRFVSSGDNFSIGMSSPSVGDTFDVREVRVYAGDLPAGLLPVDLTH